MTYLLFFLLGVIFDKFIIPIIETLTELITTKMAVTTQGAAVQVTKLAQEAQSLVEKIIN